MTPQQAGVSAEAVAKLVENWRGNAKTMREQSRGIFGKTHDTEIMSSAQAMEYCADELAAALATAPPEQAALCEHQSFSDRIWGPGETDEMIGIPPVQPQAVSAGALREAICNILVFGKADAQITAELELLFERRLAAHDQKVRAEVLEEAARYMDDWHSEADLPFAGDCIRKHFGLSGAAPAPAASKPEASPKGQS